MELLYYFYAHEIFKSPYMTEFFKINIYIEQTLNYSDSRLELDSFRVTFRNETAVRKKGNSLERGHFAMCMRTLAHVNPWKLA